MTVRKVEGATYKVQSRTDPAREWGVDAASGKCECPAGRSGRGCAHTQAVMNFIAADPQNEPDKSREVETKAPHLTKLGQPMGVAVSALQKEIRRGDERAACYWTMLVYNSSPNYAWKRLLLCASEDIGFGDPEAVARVGQLYQMWVGAKGGGWYVDPQHVIMAVMTLCRAKKDTQVDDLKNLTVEDIKNKVMRPILEEHEDGHTAEGKAKGAEWRDWYRFRHVVCGTPPNPYTEEMWQRHPEWQPKEYRDGDSG